MEEVVSLLLHNNVPVALVDKVDVPSQLFTTVTTGGGGVTFGAAIAEPGRLVHPFTFCVTVYVPPVETVIEAVVALLLHNNVPAAVVDKVDVPLQLSTTIISGAGGRSKIVTVTGSTVVQIPVPVPFI